VIRISFADDGSWSAVGQDLLGYKTTAYKKVATMNFGWAIEQDSRGKYAVAVHEIGHTLGFEHEHQNPAFGIVWDTKACYRYFGIPTSQGGNGWSKTDTDQNVIDTIQNAEGTSWDVASIMHYDFEPGLIKLPEKYRSGIKSTEIRGGPGVWFSQQDKIWAFTKYGLAGAAPFASAPSTPASVKPVIDTPAVGVVKPVATPAAPAPAAKALAAGSAEQLPWQAGSSVSYHINCKETRKYLMTTVGKCDCNLTLLDDGEVVEARDTTYDDNNAKLNVELTQGRQYTLSVHMVWRNDKDPVLIALV